jgi:hypothetical protein
MINNIEEYLSQLRNELSGSDPATVQNALADSEEYLRTALESDPDLQSVIEEYGSPEELAANYRELEERTLPPIGSSSIKRSDKKTSPSRTYSAFWIVTGSIIAFISFTLILGGGGILWAVTTLTDDDGYFMSDPVYMTRGSNAIISEPAEIELGLSRAFDLGLADLKGEVENSDPAGNIFVGVAREDDLVEYLENVPHERITEFRIESAELDYETVSGDVQPVPPVTQTFWVQSTHGAGEQTLSWEPETGTWVLVIMNEDGSSGIDVSAKIGARVPWLFGIGIGLLIGGIIGLPIGILLVIFGGRRRSDPEVRPEPGRAA